MSEVEIIEEHGSQVLLTKDGHEMLKAELARLTGEARAEIAERIRESQQHGEFSEDNSELDQVKTEQAFVENRIAELRSILSHCAELDEETIPTDHVGLGSIVKIEDLEFADTFEVRVVSSIEADPNKDYLSAESPMGLALYGHQPGETVSVDTPDGKKKLKIHAIRR
ncbi:MAG TPA: transcription elongation factor GreA [Fimbriimonas sp.]|nr:transcription elongation factor GreA [Fimbriimonas sp.]